MGELIQFPLDRVRTPAGSKNATNSASRFEKLDPVGLVRIAQAPDRASSRLVPPLGRIVTAAEDGVILLAAAASTASLTMPAIDNPEDMRFVLRTLGRNYLRESLPGFGALEQYVGQNDMWGVVQRTDRFALASGRNEVAQATEAAQMVCCAVLAKLSVKQIVSVTPERVRDAYDLVVVAADLADTNIGMELPAGYDFL